ncbi:MAG: hypothetical protein IFK92_07880 [Acidobacteria bacterium]|nr:hypothetical protein [Candidatus Sulfomarinibacter kjeldsenii]
MQASVAVGLLTDRRACGATVLPLFFVVVERNCSSQPLDGEEKWRGLRSQSAGRWGGTPSRTLEFGPVFRPNGSWLSFGGRDLAMQKKAA